MSNSPSAPVGFEGTKLPTPPHRAVSRAPIVLGLLAFAVIPVNFVVWWNTLSDRHFESTGMLLFTLFAFAQFVLGLLAVILGVRAQKRQQAAGSAPIVLGSLAISGAFTGWVLGFFTFFLGAMAGSAWGRPLRVRGKQLHALLRKGSDWTRAGVRPNAADVDDATRAALEALWLHDAQKEHASVPAFSRVSWLLAAAGAPPDLLKWAQRATLEEIEHTELCFALAAGYGGSSHSVRPMPALMGAPLARGSDDALAVLARESLADGCQLEDFNADVAAACAVVCQEPVTRAVLEQIAREERSHAELSWAILAFCLEQESQQQGPITRVVEDCLASLEGYPRPTAVSADKQHLVDAADAAALRAHGRLPDEEWAACWNARLAHTRARVRDLLASSSAAASPASSARRAA